MTADQPRAEPLGDHDYLVHLGEGEETAEIRMHASPSVVGRMVGTDVDEVRVIEATVAYLIGRQRADDLPVSLDLEDVVAAYDGYVEDIHRQLGS
jgi:hypothetical protein